MPKIVKKLVKKFKGIDQNCNTWTLSLTPQKDNKHRFDVNLQINTQIIPVMKIPSRREAESFAVMLEHIFNINKEDNMNRIAFEVEHNELVEFESFCEQQQLKQSQAFKLMFDLLKQAKAPKQEAIESVKEEAQSVQESQEEAPLEEPKETKPTPKKAKAKAK